MMLEYRKVYLVKVDGGDQPILAIAPRYRRSLGKPFLEYLTDSSAPGRGGHTILNPTFTAGPDGEIVVIDQDRPESVWRFVELTEDHWETFIAPLLSESDVSMIRKILANGFGIQQHYWDQRVDEDFWSEET